MIARLFGALLEVAFRLIRALLGGLVRAPLTAVSHATRPIQIRRGTADEVVDVRQSVLRAGLPRDTAIFAGDREPTTRHWVADRDGIVIGVVTVIDAPLPVGPRWQLRGMAVLPEYRSSGVGAALLAATQTEVAEPMWCNARERAEPFYARHGWQPVGERFDIPGVGPHRRMLWRP